MHLARADVMCDVWLCIAMAGWVAESARFVIWVIINVTAVQIHTHTQRIHLAKRMWRMRYITITIAIELNIICTTHADWIGTFVSIQLQAAVVWSIPEDAEKMRKICEWCATMCAVSIMGLRPPSPLKKRYRTKEIDSASRGSGHPYHPLL